MRKLYITFILFIFCADIFAQPKKLPKVDQLFLNYITDNLALNQQEAAQMQVLAPQYFNDLRKINKNFADPLLRDQQKANLKVAFRKNLIPVLGTRRAQQFFAVEQQFRRRVREELQQRNQAAVD